MRDRGVVPLVLWVLGKPPLDHRPALDDALSLSILDQVQGHKRRSPQIPRRFLRVRSLFLLLLCPLGPLPTDQASQESCHRYEADITSVPVFDSSLVIGPFQETKNQHKYGTFSKELSHEAPQRLCVSSSDSPYPKCEGVPPLPQSPFQVRHSGPKQPSCRIEGSGKYWATTLGCNSAIGDANCQANNSNPRSKASTMAIRGLQESLKAEGAQLVTTVRIGCLTINRHFTQEKVADCGLRGC